MGETALSVFDSKIIKPTSEPTHHLPPPATPPLLYTYIATAPTRPPPPLSLLSLFIFTQVRLPSSTMADETHIVAKAKRAKRTKRQRHSSSPFLLPLPSSASSASSLPPAGDPSSDITTTTITTTAQNKDEQHKDHVEEEMANCLILLAQGRRPARDPTPTRQRLSDKDIPAFSKIYDAYECKTCNRSFGSFQALGGHRASHRRPRNLPQAKSTAATDTATAEGEKGKRQKIASSSIPLSSSSSSSISLKARDRKALNPVSPKGDKVHDCSVCGSIFSSGQALGGHMRRHRDGPQPTASRVAAAAAESHDSVEPRRVLLLDLNLPAPEEEPCDSDNFQFSSGQSHLGFAAPAPFDCNY